MIDFWYFLKIQLVRELVNNSEQVFDCLVGLLVGLNFGLEKHSGLFWTVWDSSRRIIRRHANKINKCNDNNTRLACV